ncbi:MAG: PDZ domain-containing protein [Verrucomicrobiaceae bacterium]|nr:MAG: PDZ domain-containing protein [Verrucomicrobiaceae bacterium]
MKTTCLFIALSGLAMAQEPVPAVPSVPAVPGVPAVPAVPQISMGAGAMPLAELQSDWVMPTERAQLAEPLSWTYHQAYTRALGLDRTGPIGFIGVNAKPLPRELSAHLSLPEDTGLLVEVVSKDSPAEKGGLQANDVLAKLDDQILIDQRQFSVLVANKKEGDTVKITYIRKGETHETSVVIGKREGSGPSVGKAEADVLLKHTDGAPLRTFVRRFKMPDGGSGEIKIAGEDAGVEILDASATPAPSGPPAPPNDDVKKQLEEIRAMLEALQQRVK